MNGWYDIGVRATIVGGDGGGTILGGAGAPEGGDRAVGVSGGEVLGSFAGAVGPSEFGDAGTGDKGGGVVAAGVAVSSVGIGPTGYDGGSFEFEVTFNATA